MHRLAWCASQRKLPFKDREACQRTPQGMAAYLACLEKVRRNRFIIKSDGKYSMPQVSLLKENGTREPSGSDMSSNYTREGSSNLTEEDTALLPEVIYPWNCVPDNPVPSRKRLHDDRHVVESMGPLDRLHLVSSQSHPGAKESLGIRSELRSPGSRQFESVSWKSEKTKSLTRRTGISEEEAHSVLQKAVVRIAADVGVQGLKQGAMECLSQLMSCHIRKLGSILRLLVDSYRSQCSQKELLKIFLGNCGCGDFGRLMEYTKAGIRFSGNQQSQPRNNPTQPLPVQPQVHQVQPESKLMTQQLSQQMPLLQQQSLTLQSQQLPDKGRRRQVSTPRGTIGGISSSTGRKSDKERGADIKSEMGTEAFNATDPKQSVQNVPLVSQQHQSSWQQQQQQPQQQQQLMQLTQSHHPHVMQQQVKQLSSSQLPSSIQQQSLLLRDTIPTKPPHVKVEGLHELMGSDVSIKQETEDDREGIIGSPSKRKR